MPDDPDAPGEISPPGSPENAARARVKTLEKDLARVREGSDPDALVAALGDYGQALVQLGTHDPTALEQAVAVFEDIAELAGQESDARVEASARATLGLVHALLGAYERSSEYYLAALALFKDLSGVEPELLECVKGVGVNLIKLRDPRGALLQFENGLELARQFRDPGNILDCLANLIYIHESLGHWDKLAHLYRESLATFRELGDREGEVTTLVNLAIIYQRLHRQAPGDFPKGDETAAKCLRRALAVSRKYHLRRLRAKVHERLADQAIKTGDPAAAADHFEEALTTYETLELPDEVRRVQLALAVLGKRDPRALAE